VYAVCLRFSRMAVASDCLRMLIRTGPDSVVKVTLPQVCCHLTKLPCPEDENRGVRKGGVVYGGARAPSSVQLTGVSATPLFDEPGKPLNRLH
jgi:hypothetical protein